MERSEIGRVLQNLYNDAIKAPKVFKPEELEALQLAAWEFDPHCIGCDFYRSDGLVKKKKGMVEVFKCRNVKSPKYWRYTGWRDGCDQWMSKTYVKEEVRG